MLFLKVDHLPVAWDRLRAFGAFAVKPLLRLAQPRAATLAVRDVVRQLVAATRGVDVVLRRVEPIGLLEDLRRDLLVAVDRFVGR